MNFIKLSFIMLLFSLHAEAQSDYREGYIIGIKNDTTFGYINFNSDLFFTCKFKATKEAVVQTIRPNEISGFRFLNDKYFVSKKIKLKRSNVIHKQLEFTAEHPEGFISKSWSSDSGYVEENVFLEYLLNGKVNIFFFRDESDNDHYFAQKQNDTLVDLSNNHIIVYHNGVIYSEGDQNNFKGKFSYIMSDYPKLQKEINNTDLSHKSLIKLGKKYHQFVCNDTACIIYQRKINPLQLHVGFYAGMAYSELHYVRMYDLFRPLFSTGNYPVFGSQLYLDNCWSSRERLSLKLFVNYSRVNYTGSDKIGPYSPITVPLEIRAAYLNGGIQMMNKLSTKANSLYYSLGFEGQYSLQESFRDSLDYVEIDRTTYSQLRLGLNLSAGLEWSLPGNGRNKVFVEATHHQLVDQFYSTLVVGCKF